MFISLDTRYVQEMVKRGVTTVGQIQQRNREFPQPDFKTILREPVQVGSLGSAVNCEEMVRYKCGWGAPGEFKDNTSNALAMNQLFERN